MNLSLHDIAKSQDFPASLFIKKPKLRSSRPEMFCKKGVLRNFAKLTRKLLCQSLF